MSNEESSRADLADRLLGTGSQGAVIARSENQQAQFRRKGGASLIHASAEHAKKPIIKAFTILEDGGGSAQVTPFGPDNPAPVLDKNLPPVPVRAKEPALVPISTVIQVPALQAACVSIHQTTSAKPIPAENPPVAQVTERQASKTVVLETAAGDFNVLCFDVVLNAKSQVISLIMPLRPMFVPRAGTELQMDLNGRRYHCWCPGMYTEIEMFGCSVCQFTYKTPEQIEAERSSPTDGPAV